MSSDQSASFLIRVWRNKENQCVGHIEIILTGQKLHFEGLQNLQVTLENLLEEKSQEIKKSNTF